MKKTVKPSNLLRNNAPSKTDKDYRAPANSHFTNVQKRPDRTRLKDDDLRYIYNAAKEVPSIEYDDLDLLMPDNFEMFGVRFSSEDKDDI